MTLSVFITNYNGYILTFDSYMLAQDVKQVSLYSTPFSMYSLFFLLSDINASGSFGIYSSLTLSRYSSFRYNFTSVP